MFERNKKDCVFGQIIEILLNPCEKYNIEYSFWHGLPIETIELLLSQDELKKYPIAFNGIKAVASIHCKASEKIVQEFSKTRFVKGLNLRN